MRKIELAKWATADENRDTRMMLIKNLGVQMLPLLWLAMLLVSHDSRADKITIGSGRGVVWSGFPFSGTLKGPTTTDILASVSFIVIGTAGTTSCDFGAPSATIDGVTGIKLAPGVILTPRASVNGYFKRYNGDTAPFGGSIGFPINKMVMLDDQSDMSRSNFGVWCFGPLGNNSSSINKFFDAKADRVVNYSGDWVVIADGTQVSNDNINVPAFSISSNVLYNPGNLKAQILPTTITMRVSTLSCIIDTPTAINFGNVQRNSQTGSELARVSNQLNISCSQPTDMINANINVQFRAISGQYNGNVHQLALRQGGGYVTGEINNSVTGSGACNANAGIPFDNTQIKVGAITSEETSKISRNNVTWRLCSGGSSLPVGAVDASAELMATFN